MKEMEKTREISVTYMLCGDELDAVQKLADQNGYTLEKQFELMMTAGCKWDIEGKIKFWQQMHENEMKKQAEKISLTFVGEDDFGRAVFEGSNNKAYVTTDLILRKGWEAMDQEEKEILLHSLHSRTDYGEPDCPKWREGVFSIA